MSRSVGSHERTAEIAHSASPAAAKWRDRLEDLLRIRDLHEDWDGQGAACPDSGLVNVAVDWLRSMPVLDPMASPPAAVAASPGGEIVFVWQETGTYLEAEIVSPDRVEWMRSVPGEPVQHWESGPEGIVADPAQKGPAG